MAAIELSDAEAVHLVALLSVSATALRQEYDRDPRPDRLRVWLATVDLLAKVQLATGMPTEQQGI